MSPCSETRKTPDSCRVFFVKPARDSQQICATETKRETMYEPIEEETTFKSKAKSFLIQCARVLKVTKKPDRDEYRLLVKVSGLGIAVIGFIGFLLHVIKILILGQ